MRLRPKRRTSPRSRTRVTERVKNLAGDVNAGGVDCPK